MSITSSRASSKPSMSRTNYSLRTWRFARLSGRGLGSKLIAHAEGVAASLGHERIWLYTNKQFTQNITLYLKLGYHVDREEDVGGGTVRVDMSKSLGR
ncbi:MAG: GNAT family N-acetyltransferase [Caulobacteraceae bacterium]